MIKIIENTKDRVLFEKETRQEPWFNNDCSNENLKKQCNRENDTISRVQFGDGKYIGSELMVYFDNTNEESNPIPDFNDILNTKQTYYGFTQGAIEFAAEEYATRKMIEENKSILKMAELHMDKRACFVIKERIKELENMLT